eukprot:6684720-Prymnesium_polylepis.2
MPHVYVLWCVGRSVQYVLRLVSTFICDGRCARCGGWWRWCGAVPGWRIWGARPDPFCASALFGRDRIRSAHSPAQRAASIPPPIERDQHDDVPHIHGERVVRQCIRGARGEAARAAAAGIDRRDRDGPHGGADGGVRGQAAADGSDAVLQREVRVDDEHGELCAILGEVVCHIREVVRHIREVRVDDEHGELCALTRAGLSCEGWREWVREAHATRTRHRHGSALAPPPRRRASVHGAHLVRRGGTIGTVAPRDALSAQVASGCPKKGAAAVGEGETGVAEEIVQVDKKARGGRVRERGADRGGACRTMRRFRAAVE